jgi:hypothetical protein
MAESWRNSCEFQSNAQVGVESGVKMSKKSQKFQFIYKKLQKLAEIHKNEPLLNRVDWRYLRI